jgi:glycosyltransferase involved in cell wall biosynthesis
MRYALALARTEETGARGFRQIKSTVSNSKIIVAQLGARMHYAVPRIFHQAGRLEHLYTDFSANRGWPQLFNLIPQATRPRSVQRLLGRVAQGIPPEKITAFNWLGMRYAQKLRRGRTAADQTAAFVWSGKLFGKKVLARGFGDGGAVYTFNTAGMEILEAARHQGLLTVSEQTIAPKRVELELLQPERATYPGWEPECGLDPLVEELMAREQAEWAAAKIILCASEFVRDGIACCGGPVEKCVIVPYGVDGEKQKAESKWEKSEIGNLKSEIRNRPLRVLTVGSVGLRKGSPYVLAAAKLLKGKAEFRMVGGVGVLPGAEAQLREHLELTGPVPRSEIAKHFAWADVFLLPSLCEGSATVTYEAMAQGLPVICTPNTGSVVRDGVDGFIVPIRDATAIAARLEQLAVDTDLRENFSANARQRASEFTVAAYGRRLVEVIK